MVWESVSDKWSKKNIAQLPQQLNGNCGWTDNFPRVQEREWENMLTFLNGSAPKQWYHIIQQYIISPCQNNLLKFHATDPFPLWLKVDRPAMLLNGLLHRPGKSPIAMSYNRRHVMSVWWLAWLPKKTLNNYLTTGSIISFTINNCNLTNFQWADLPFISDVSGGTHTFTRNVH